MGAGPPLPAGPRSGSRTAIPSPSSPSMQSSSCIAHICSTVPLYLASSACRSAHSSRGHPSILALAPAPAQRKEREASGPQCDLIRQPSRRQQGEAALPGAGATRGHRSPPTPQPLCFCCGAVASTPACLQRCQSACDLNRTQHSCGGPFLSLRACLPADQTFKLQAPSAARSSLSTTCDRS